MTTLPDLSRLPDLIELSIIGMCLFKAVPRLHNFFSVPWPFRAWSWGSIVASYATALALLSGGSPPEPLVLAYELVFCCWLLWIPGGVVGLAVGSLYRIVAGDSAPRMLGCGQHMALATGGTLAERSRHHLALYARPSIGTIIFYVAGLPSVMLGVLSFFGSIIYGLIAGGLALLNTRF